MKNAKKTCKLNNRDLNRDSKSTHIEIQSNNPYITRNEGFQFTVFDKNCTQENVKYHIQYEDN